MDNVRSKIEEKMHYSRNKDTMGYRQFKENSHCLEHSAQSLKDYINDLESNKPKNYHNL